MKGTREDDGDYQFNLLLDQPYKKLLNEQNNKQVNGMLVIEIIPKDQGSKLVQIPKNGDKIEAYGAWVTAINSSSLSNATKFVLSGDWNLTVNTGKVTNFAAKFIKVLNDSSRWHTHIINLKPANINNTIVQLSINKSSSIPGTFDIKLNNTSAWNNVKTNILISKGKVITINLDNSATSNHFQG